MRLSVQPLCSLRLCGELLRSFYHRAALLVFDEQITKCNSSSAKNKGFFVEFLRRYRDTEIA